VDCFITAKPILHPALSLCLLLNLSECYWSITQPTLCLNKGGRLETGQYCRVLLWSSRSQTSQNRTISKWKKKIIFVFSSELCFHEYFQDSMTIRWALSAKIKGLFLQVTLLLWLPVIKGMTTTCLPMIWNLYDSGSTYPF